jgi:predicted CXXCH cytochrome family protein
MAQGKSPGGDGKSGKRRMVAWGGAVALIIAVAIAVVWFHDRKNPEETSRQKSAPGIAAIRYVGSDACQSCHATEAAEWRQSQHRAAMAEASEQTMLGNFDEAKFTYAGVISTFFKRDGKFYVRTDGPDGKLADFQIKYTFGVYPLQQYLVEFPDGRLQTLSIAWDARAAKDRGQRWFHLYPRERITHDDELHWTRPAQNWNFTCADCHSTELRKNYDPAANRFQTHWSEISVGCEACHGPGSRHLAWAEANKTDKSAAADDTKGLSARLDERRDVTWAVNAESGKPTRSRPRTAEREIEVCAQCHSRRSQIADGYEAGKPFLDYYRPALLTIPLYHVDGQQRDEVYNWGSFLQSKMFASGVTCSDCHNPHSGKLRADGNAICANCHLPGRYDTAQHHHHKPGSAGAECTACHMPTTTYMVVDPRHDHSMRVPRPDLSAKLGTPNACNGCHANRDARWAAAQVNQWYGHDPQGYQRFAAAFAAANEDVPGAQAQLRALAGDSTQPPIVRATAFAETNASNSRTTIETVAQGLRDSNPLVRLGALQSLATAPPDVRASLAVPLLSDPLRTVRIEAASVLAAVPAAQLSVDARAAFERAAGEYIESQRYNADRADARVNLGTFYANRGDVVRAEEEIKAAILLEPRYIPAYVNLADLYRASGRDADGEPILREGLKVAPKSAVLHYALGLALVRMKHTDAALVEFERATVLDPGDARMAYVYAVALHSTGKPGEAIAKLEKALAVHPYDRNILEALVSFHAARGEGVAAKKYAMRLQALSENGHQP